ncbi:MAG: PKD domain-containing protein, partial [Bacteroidota bacterium]
NVGGTILPVVPPGGGNNALRIGDLHSWGNASWGAARASISFTVSASNSNFTYRYAVVLNDPSGGHNDNERPYFGVKVRDASNNIITCGEYFVMAKPPFVGFFETSPFSDMWYRPWTTVFVPLQAYIGQCITVEFTSSDCTQGGHVGYGYVDCACEPLDIIASSPNICGSNSVTLSAPAGGAAYVWTNTAGGTTGIVGSTTGQTASVNLAGTYQVVVTSVAGPTCKTTLNITIGSSPSFPVSQFAHTTVCVGSPMQFTDISTPLGSITAWAWDFDNDSITDDTTQNPTHIFTANGTYPVKLTIGWGLCNADTTINVIVNAVIPVVNPAGPFCPNDAPLNLTADIPGGVWSGIGITNPAAGTFSPSPSVIGNDTITYTVGGSCSASSSQVIIVNPLPIADAGPDLNICSFGTGSIGASSTAGCTYIWSPTTGFTGSTTISNPSLSLANPGPTATITSPYSVTISDTSTGCEASDTVNVIVSAVTNVNAGSTQSVCSGSSITLAGTIGGSATSGTWSGGTGTYAPDNTTLNAVYTPSIFEYASGAVVLTLTTNDPAGPCTFSSSNVTFNFYEIPVVNFSADAPLGCPLLCVNFTDLSTIGGADFIASWNWNFGDDSAIPPIPNPSHCFSESGLYDITLIVTSNHGCISSLTQSQFVQVYNIPVAAFDPTPNPASVIDPIITFNDQSSSDVIYWLWDFGDSTTLGPNTPSPIHEYPKDVSATYLITLIVHNANGCYDTIAHPIFIGPEFTFFIPNAFTPNGDKVNDYFFGSGVGIIKYDLWIFDRWGDMIFHGKELNDKWDGKANKGDKGSQMDVYVWKVTLTDVFNEVHNYIGIVSLVK